MRKCYRRSDYLRAERRDAAPRGVVPGGSRDVDLDGSGTSWWEAIDREPTPVEAAMLTETVEQLLVDLGGPEREIVELSLQGHTTPEIAARLGRSRRTVRRVRERVRDYLLQLQREDGGGARRGRPDSPSTPDGGTAMIAPRSDPGGRVAPPVILIAIAIAIAIAGVGPPGASAGRGARRWR